MPFVAINRSEIVIANLRKIIDLIANQSHCELQPQPKWLRRHPVERRTAKTTCSTSLFSRPHPPPAASAQGLLRVKGGCGRQADGAAGLPPAPEIPVRSGTYASCHKRKTELPVEPAQNPHRHHVGFQEARRARLVLKRRVNYPFLRRSACGSHLVYRVIQWLQSEVCAYNPAQALSRPPGRNGRVADLHWGIGWHT